MAGALPADRHARWVHGAFDGGGGHWAWPPVERVLLERLSARTANTLARGGYFSAAEVTTTPDAVLRATRGLGAGGMAEIRRHFPYRPAWRGGEPAAGAALRGKHPWWLLP